jgi:hypothetical protein
VSAALKQPALAGVFAWAPDARGVPVCRVGAWHLRLYDSGDWRGPQWTGRMVRDGGREETLVHERAETNAKAREAARAAIERRMAARLAEGSE